jgi:hypothetical protein
VTQTTLPRPAVVLDTAVDDTDLVRHLIDTRSPYWPVQRYFANSAEYAALSGEDEPAEMIVAPVFRGSWATEGVAEPGVEPLLHNPRFVAAAEQLFGASIVRPQTVYVNLTWQLPFPQGAGHTDIPAFRGFDRTEHPVTFLTLMGLSGLFEEERLKVATAVSWFYRGRDGGFEYWPDGPDGAPVVHEGAIDNTAIVGDNDFMWHRVRPTGRVEDGMVTLTLDSELVHDGDGRWRIVDGDREVAAFPADKLRVSLSWKALCFTSDEDRRRHDDHTDDLALDEVLRRFADDLGARGVDVTLPTDDPTRDPAFIRVLRETYVRYPTTPPVLA